MSDTPTPRTDAQEFIPVRECGHFPPYPTVSAGFARQIERELAEATKQRDALADIARQVRAGYGGQVVDPDCACDDCEFLAKLDSALATLEGRGSNPAQESPPTTP